MIVPCRTPSLVPAVTANCWPSGRVRAKTLAAPLHGRTSEVDRVLWVPLHDLTRPGTFREEWWHTPIGERPIYFFELDDETVWGATARVLHQLLRVAHGIADLDDAARPPAL